MPLGPARLERPMRRRPAGTGVAACVVVVVAGAGCFRSSDRPPPRPENLFVPPNNGGLREGVNEEPPPGPTPPPPPLPVEGAFPDLDPDDGVPATSCALPADDSGEIVVLAAAAGATDIVADDGVVHWLAVDDDGAGELVRAVGDEAPEVLGAAGTNPTGLRSVSGGLFWAELVSYGRLLAWFGTDVVFVGQDDGVPRVVDTNLEHVCWAATGTLRCGELLGEPAAARLFEGPQTIRDVRVLGDGFVYWADASPNGRVNRAPISGGVREVMLTDVGPPEVVRFDHGDAFVRTGAAVLRLTDQGATIDLVTGDARQFTLDADTVYWTTVDGRVLKRARAGGDVLVIAADMPSPSAVTVDGCFVYWTDTADGSVRRARK